MVGTAYNSIRIHNRAMTKKDDSKYLRKILYLAVFAVAMGYLESVVVVYLRELYYPGGFAFPLKDMPYRMAMLEFGREAATIIMLLMVAVIAGRGLWARFAHFIFIFGIWDISYYVWLKVAINWPGGFLDSDILFLIPVPWVGPVIAPVLISTLMIISGLYISRLGHSGINFRPGIRGWILTLVGISIILYTFMRDGRSILYGAIPRPFPYWLYALGLGICILGFAAAYLKSKKTRNQGKD